MSKLFETLETIKRRESTGSPRLASSRKAAAARPVKRDVLVLLFFLLLGGGLYLLIFGWDKRPADNLPRVAETQARPPVNHRTKAMPPASDRPTKLVETNNLAVACIRNHDHWRAVYLLTSLVEQYPERIEPLINLGVALAEVGLWEPAREYLSRARTLSPDHPLLKENIAILKRAGLFDEFPRTSLKGGGSL